MDDFREGEKVRTYFGKELYIKCLGEISIFCVENLTDLEGWYFSPYELTKIKEIEDEY